MLEALRSRAGGIFAKILMALLVLSFAVWGIGDIFQAGGSAPVGKAGSISISPAEYEQAMRREVEGFRRILGDSYSPELLKNMGLERQVLQKLVQRALFAQEAAAIGLAVDDNQVASHIRTNPLFYNERGSFDPALFQQGLRSLGTSEKTFVARMKNDLVTDALGKTFNFLPLANDYTANLLYEVHEEQRVADAYIIARAQAGALAQPDEAALKAFHQEHAARFTAPEYRRLSYLTLSAQDAQRNMKLSEAAIEAAYKEQLDNLKQPEKRLVEQLLYAGEKEAQAAYESLRKGASARDLARTTNILNKDAVSLGLVERTGVPGGAETAVFSLKEGEVAPPVSTAFGWHVFRVVKIEPGKVPSLAESRERIVKQLSEESREENIYKLTNTLQDELAGGGTLEEAAAKIGVRVMKVGPVDAGGKMPEGKQAAALPDFENFLSVAFKTEEKGISPLTLTKAGPYFIVRVDSVLPEQLRPFDEVRSEVRAAWEKEELAGRLKALAENASAKLQASATPDAAAAQIGLRATPLGRLHRGMDRAAASAALPGGKLPPGLVADVFTLKKGASGKVYAVDGHYLIPVLREVIPAAQASLTPEQRRRILQETRRQLQAEREKEVLAQYLQHLQRKYPVSVNEAALSQTQE